MLSSMLTIMATLALGPVLELPWGCGETYQCTQSNGGQVSHTGFAQYAWDFGMPLGTDIHAARGGTVVRIRMDSLAGGCSNQFANDANYIVIDHGDGTGGLYLHMEGNSSNLQLNSQVQEGDVIARVGLTGWTCGPHLHFQVQELCQSWWCQSLASEFFGVGVIEWPNSGQSENCGPCMAALAGGQTTISESEIQCFDRLTSYWWDAGEGLDGSHWYTLATAAQQPETIGRWRFGVDVPGNYEVEVHVPAGNADATGASYAIHHGGQVTNVPINQATQKGWRLLGSYWFNGNGDEYVELPDNTGDNDSPLAYDSVRFTFVDGGGDGDGDPDPTTTGGDGDGDGDPDPSTGDPSTSGDGDGDDCFVGELGCMCTLGGGCDPGAICVDGYCVPEDGGPGGGSGDEEGNSGDEGSSSSGAEAGDSSGDTGFTGGGGAEDGLDFRGEGGCACATDSQPRPGGGLGWLGLIMLGVFVRRRS